MNSFIVIAKAGLAENNAGEILRLMMLTIWFVPFAVYPSFWDMWIIGVVQLVLIAVVIWKRCVALKDSEKTFRKKVFDILLVYCVTTFGTNVVGSFANQM